MIEHDNDLDPWSLEALQSAPAPDDGPLLSIDTIEGVVPLGDQMGVHPPKTVPDTLYEPLFGQPEPTDAEVATAGGDPENVPPMQTYAILDAAKVFGLPEMLDSSGLEHRCLFKGDAYDELKDVAPWIVRLEDDNDFTRKLFTEGEPPWCMWDKEPGIYVRSRGSLNEMWRHFRKFTKIQDENGKWFYIRFWEPIVTLMYFHTIKDDVQKCLNWFYSKQNRVPVIFVAIESHTKTATAIRPNSSVDLTHTPMGVLTLGQPEKVALNNARVERDVAELTTLLMQSFPEQIKKIDHADADKIIRKSVSRMGDFQIRQKDNLFRLVAWDLHTNGAFEKEDPNGQLKAILELDISETDKMRRLTERISELGAQE